MSTETNETPAESEKIQRTIYYIKDGKMKQLIVNTDKVYQTRTEKGDANEKPEEEPSEDELALMAAVAHSYKECDDRVKQLAVDGADGESPLYKMLVEMREKKFKKHQTDLRYVRSAHHLQFTATETPIWTELEIKNMADEDGKKKFPAEVLAHYEMLEPSKTNIRLALFDNIFACKALGMLVLQRLFAFFTLYDPADAKTTGGAANRLKMHEKSIVFTHMSYGFTAYQEKPAQAPVDKEADKELLALKIKTLAAANERYMQQRYETRNNLLRANMSLIADFVILIFGAALIERLDAAAPSVPERIVLRLPVEKSGNVVDIDRSLFATQSDVQKSVQELHVELKQKTEALRTLLAAEKKAQASEIEQAAAELRSAELILHRTTQIDQALKNVHGDRQILLHVVEKGYSQDEGVTIDVLYTLTIPYDVLRPRIAAIKKQLALEQAEKAAHDAEKKIEALETKIDAKLDALEAEIGAIAGAEPLEKDKPLEQDKPLDDTEQKIEEAEQKLEEAEKKLEQAEQKCGTLDTKLDQMFDYVEQKLALVTSAMPLPESETTKPVEKSD